MIKLFVLTFIFCGFAEEAPEAEFPYPERTVASDSLGVENPVRKNDRGEFFYETKTKTKKRNPYQGVEQPYKITDDGVYHYQTKGNDKDAEGYHGVEQPEDKDDEGGYYYSTKKEKKEPKVNFGLKPSRVTSDGAYIYDAEPGETKNVFSLRGGLFSAPQVTTTEGTPFESIYGNESNFVLNLEYDWKITNSLFFKFSSGIASMQGQGRFRTGTRTAKESFQFYIFPNTFNLAYKFEIGNIQYLTPYVEAGPGYFTFMEVRSDGDLFSFGGDTNKVGGALVASATGGLLISITKLAGGSSFTSEYGATQAWIDLQFKQIFGLDKRKDFTSNMITAGIAIGF